MAYVTKSSRPFVYGAFHIKQMLPPQGTKPPFALEILREFSSNELIAKIYQSTGSSWVPVQPQSLNSFEWFSLYGKTRGKMKIAFQMEGSGPWDVEHFREESDETGLYVAVALKRT